MECSFIASIYYIARMKQKSGSVSDSTVEIGTEEKNLASRKEVLKDIISEVPVLIKFFLLKTIRVQAPFEPSSISIFIKMALKFFYNENWFTFYVIYLYGRHFFPWQLLLINICRGLKDKSNVFDILIHLKFFAIVCRN